MRVVHREFEPRSGQTKDYRNWYLLLLCIECQRAKNGWNWNQDILSDWSDLSTRRLFFQWTCTMKIQLLSMLIYSTKRTSSTSHWMYYISPWYRCKTVHLANKQHCTLTHLTLLCFLYSFLLNHTKLVSENRTFHNII